MFLETFVRAADIGEQTIPPMPITFSADRGDDLLVPKLPDVLRTCGGPDVVLVVVPGTLEGDMEGDDLELLAPPLPPPLRPPDEDVVVRRMGDRPRPVP